MAKNSKQIVIAGYYGYGNAGDEIILQKLLAGLKTRFPDFYLTILIGNNYKKHYQSSERIHYIGRYNIYKIIRCLSASKVLLMGGGSLIQDVSGKFTIHYYYLLIILAKIMGKKIIIFNQGIGPINKKFNKIVGKLIFNKIDLLVVRDAYSKRVLKSYIEDEDKIIIGSDMLFDNISLCKEKKSEFPGKIGISIRKWKHHKMHEKFKPIIHSLKMDGWSCYDLRMHVPMDNFAVNDIEQVSWDDTDKLINIISELDVIIGMRLHSLMLGVLYNIPVIGINYDPKIKHFCDFMEIPCLEINEINCKIIKSLLSEMNGRITDYTAKIDTLKCRLNQSWQILQNSL